MVFRKSAPADRAVGWVVLDSLITGSQVAREAVVVNGTHFGTMA